MEQNASGGTTVTPTQPGTERRSQYPELRKHIQTGGLCGNLLFIFGGCIVGFYYGGLGGTRFFEELFLVKRAGSLAAIAGSVTGVLMGLICVWAICVVSCSCGGAMIYWLKHRQWPLPTERSK